MGFYSGGTVREFHPLPYSPVVVDDNRHLKQKLSVKFRRSLYTAIQPGARPLSPDDCALGTLDCQC